MIATALILLLALLGLSIPVGAALGVLFAFVAGLFWGAYVLVADRASGHFSGSDGVALAMVVAALAEDDVARGILGDDEPRFAFTAEAQSLALAQREIG